MGIDYKDIKGKLPMQDIHPIAMKSLAEVLRYGIEKYGEKNKVSYKYGVKDTYIGALLRHLNEYQLGEINDKDSGLSHLKHLLFNAYVLVYLEYLEEGGEVK